MGSGYRDRGVRADVDDAMKKMRIQRSVAIKPARSLPG